jgi:hypothetical protein
MRGQTAAKTFATRPLARRPDAAQRGATRRWSGIGRRSFPS